MFIHLHSRNACQEGKIYVMYSELLQQVKQELARGTSESVN